VPEPGTALPLPSCMATVPTPSVMFSASVPGVAPAHGSLIDTPLMAALCPDCTVWLAGAVTTGPDEPPPPAEPVWVWSPEPTGAGSDGGGGAAPLPPAPPISPSTGWSGTLIAAVEVLPKLCTALVPLSGSNTWMFDAAEPRFNVTVCGETDTSAGLFGPDSRVSFHNASQ